MRNMFVCFAACGLVSLTAYAGDSDSAAPVASAARPDGTVSLKS
jgi:hypothetical protein